jgi:hypothetical protein
MPTASGLPAAAREPILPLEGSEAALLDLTRAFPSLHWAPESTGAPKIVGLMDGATVEVGRHEGQWGANVYRPGKQTIGGLGRSPTEAVGVVLGRAA